MNPIAHDLCMEELLANIQWNFVDPSKIRHSMEINAQIYITNALWGESEPEHKNFFSKFFS